jgi:glutamate carboxypeptidase
LTRDVDWAFVFEWGPEPDALLLKRKGVGIFHVEVEGKSAHAGEEPEKGANAILAVADKIIQLHALTDYKGGTTVNVGVVEGGTRPYVVPDSARAEVDVRVPNGQEQKRMLSALKEIIEKKEVPGTICTLSGEFHRPPLEPLSGIEKLQDIVMEESRELGLEMRWLSAGSVSDANNIAAAGVPTIDGMGPFGRRAHSPDEFMIIPSLFKKTVLLSGILDRLIGKQICRR